MNPGVQRRRNGSAEVKHHSCLQINSSSRRTFKGTSKQKRGGLAQFTEQAHMGRKELIQAMSMSSPPAEEWLCSHCGSWQHLLLVQPRHKCLLRAALYTDVLQMRPHRQKHPTESMQRLRVVQSRSPLIIQNRGKSVTHF